MKGFNILGINLIINIVMLQYKVWVRIDTVSKKTGSWWGNFFLGGRLHLREQS